MQAILRTFSATFQLRLLIPLRRCANMARRHCEDWLAVARVVTDGYLTTPEGIISMNPTQKLMGLLGKPVVRDVLANLIRRYRSGQRWDPRSQLSLAEMDLREKVLPLLGELPGVTSEDLVEAYASLPDISATDDSAIHDRFCQMILTLAGHNWQSDAFPVGPPRSCYVMESFREGIEKDYRLWCSADDAYGVSLVGILPAGETHRLDRDVVLGNCYRIYAAIQGTCSERFFRDFCDRATVALSTLLRCLADLYDQSFLELADRALIMADRALSMNEEELSRDLKHISQLLDLTAGSTGFILSEDGETIPSEENQAYRSLDFIRDGLAAFFDDGFVKKDSIARRVRNAVRLWSNRIINPTTRLACALSDGDRSTSLHEGRQSGPNVCGEHGDFVGAEDRISG